jgi:transcriptional regulator with XRE-family HTH domain
MARKARRAQSIDAQIGHRIRAARSVLGISQMMLADALGISFQQVQKYEKGTNRISAGRLFDIAHVLEMPITYFYEGAKSAARSARRSASAASRRA